MSALATLSHLLGSDVTEKIQTAKVLMVGTGGIGCELLKNLVLSGFQDIEIVDLDTIDTSNLNRQFLFQKQHVGKSKCECAREAALKWNPNASIKAHFIDIKTWGPKDVSGFSIVLNALDNLSARRHVNRICLIADIPLIESGSAGYFGQVQVIRKSVSECFECTPTAPPKTFPICTIRSNPSTPIHCIVWAQYVYKRFFGPQDEDAEDDEKEDAETLEKDPEAEADLSEEKLKEKQEHEKRMKEDKIYLEQEKEKSFERWLFHKMFYSEVLYLSTLKHLWVERDPPVPLLLHPTQEILDPKVTGVQLEQKEAAAALIPDQRVWSLQECITVFVNTTRILKARASGGDRTKWDKDDSTHLDFATAAANIRAAIFHLDFSSRFFVKEKAGSIIPAIATTNAIIAGLIVTKVFRVLGGRISECKNTWLKKQPTRGMLFVGSSLDPPNPSCYVCGDAFITLKIDIETTRLSYFLSEIVSKEWQCLEPILTGDGGQLFYESPEEDDPDSIELAEEQKEKTLKALGINSSELLHLSDFKTDLKLSVIICHVEASKLDKDRPFEVIGGVPTATLDPQSNTNQVEEEEEEDDICIVEAPEKVGKRNRAEEEGNANDDKVCKKARA